MLTRSQQRPVRRSSHLPAQGRQPFPNSHHLALDENFRPHGDRSQVRRVDRPAHAQVIPEPRFGDERKRHRRAVIEKRRDATPVKVAEPVAVVRLDGVPEIGLGVGEGGVGGD